jgi:hypothetical protein
MAVWLKRFSLAVGWGLAISLVACATPAIPSKVPVLLLFQVSPDRLTLEAIVPNSLVRYAGGIERTRQMLNADPAPFVMVQFGKALGEFQPTSRHVVDTFGAIAIFKLAQPFVHSPLIAQRGIALLPRSRYEPLPATSPTFQHNCPARAQELVLQGGRQEFGRMGIAQSATARVAISSLVCVDIDGDQKSEIVAGLRLDNPFRPVADDAQAWQAFLNLPREQRLEYSLLICLHQEGKTWVSTPIIRHSRALSYFNDSIGSYVLANAYDLNGDRRLELVVQEIGLSTINVWLLTPDLQTTDPNKIRWLDYYLPERSLDIRE